MSDFDRFAPKGGDPSLNEINRTEKFIEALSLDRQVYATDHQEAELAQLLAAWRDDARSAPTAGIASTRDAVAALNRGSHHRPRLPLALVGSVAAAVLCLGGFGAAVYGSSPGDALYGLRGTVFGQQQVTRDVHVELAATELQQVQDLIDQGDWQAAQDKLQTATTTVATVGDEQQKQALVDQWQKLSVKVENRDPQATVPPNAPPMVLPEVPPVTSVPSATPVSVTPTSPTSTPSTTAPSSTPSSSTSGSATTTPSSSETTPSEVGTSSSEPTSTAESSSSRASATDPTSTVVPTSPAPLTQPTPSGEAQNPASGTPATPSSPVSTGTTVMPTVQGSASSPSPTGAAPGPAVSHHPQAPVAPIIELPQLPGVITAGPQR